MAVMEALRTLHPIEEGVGEKGREANTLPVKAGRFGIRLRQEEREDLDKVAKRFAQKPTQWVVSLIRANLYLEPLPSEEELTQLRRSNAELLSIGRNLNQIAHSLHKGGRLKPGSGLEEVLRTTRELIDGHVESVGVVVKAADQRWRPGTDD